MAKTLNRRRFLAQTLLGIPLPTALSNYLPRTTIAERVQKAFDIRTRTATLQKNRQIAILGSNGDEVSLPYRIGCFAKGLPQNRFGEVQSGAYNALLAALKSGNFLDFESLPRAGGRKLSNPQASYCFHLEGGDPHTFDIPPAPSIATESCAADSSALYWQALCRDTRFQDYSSSTIIRQAADNVGVQPSILFRGTSKGNFAGPYISQFLLRSIPYGSGRIEQRYNVPIAKSDYMTSLSEWSQIQSGLLPWREVTFEPKPRHILTGRDLAEFVHYDFANQAHLGAALILINANARSILNCNQFKSGNNPYRYSTVEEGFATFGPAEAVDWIGRVTTAALKATYYQKWMIHRRVRPEALGGLIHQTREGIRSYPIHQSLLQAKAVEMVHKQTNSYLLPQTYPEGCPMHPSYPSGHAAIAGACAVVLKACFDGSMLLPGCVEPSSDGLTLVPCVNYYPTVNDEIDKLAYNVAIGREWAGIHYRSDTTAGLQLGEEVGISILQDMAQTYTEQFKGFRLTRFDGTPITITPQGSIN